MEITETTCKTVRFSGIYGLYVNNGVQKTYFFGFGYWRPRVRVPPLRPTEKAEPMLCLFCWSKWLGVRNRFKPPATFSFLISWCGLMNSPQASSEFIRAMLGVPATSTKPYSFERSKCQTSCNGWMRLFLFIKQIGAQLEMSCAPICSNFLLAKDGRYVYFFRFDQSVIAW